MIYLILLSAIIAVCYSINTVKKSERTVSKLLGDYILYSKGYKVFVVEDGSLGIYSPAFNVGSYIYLEECVAEQEGILQHEITHRRQRHGIIKSAINPMIVMLMIWTLVSIGSTGEWISGLLTLAVILVLGDLSTIILNIIFEVLADQGIDRSNRGDPLALLEELEYDSMLKGNLSEYFNGKFIGVFSCIVMRDIRIWCLKRG